jgi:hypothetical protein
MFFLFSFFLLFSFPLLDKHTEHCKTTQKSSYLFIKLKQVIIFFYCNLFCFKFFYRICF